MDNIPFTIRKSKVKSATFKKDWKGRDGQMYDFNIEFENGDKGVYQVNKNPQDTFVVGTETEYSIESKDKPFPYNAIKYVPQNNGKGGGSRKQFEKNYRADHVSYAAAYTKDLMVAGKLPQGMKFEACFEMIYKVMDKKLTEVNGSNTTPPQQNGTEQK